MSSRDVEAIADRLPEATVGPVSVRDTILETARRSAADDVFGLAGELAYRSALALLPFLLFLASLPAVVGSVFSIPDLREQLAADADMLLSKNLASLVRGLLDQLRDSHGWTPFLVGLTGTFWGGISATSSLRKALNRIYKFDEDAPLLKRKLVEATLTLANGLLFTLALLCFLLGPRLFGSFSLWSQALSIAAAFALILVAIAVLFWLVPAGKNGFRWVTPGALFFGLSWLGFSVALSAYLSFSGTINQVYGSLGAVLAMLIWLYGTNLALLVGSELNAVLGEKFDPAVQSESKRQEPAASNG